jgi:SAM-dependent methyltransferase
VADLPFPLSPPLSDRLAAVIDVEGKLPRALEELGPLAGRDVLALDLPDGPLLRRLAAMGIVVRHLPLASPLRLAAGDASVDAVVSLWSGFRGVEALELAEVDRVLRPGGRLLVVHDYGRDDVSGLRGEDSPEYRVWSRRDGPFLQAGFKVRVVHCFWTFGSIEEARDLLEAAFGEPGRSLAGGLRRPRMSWNIAVYHRPRGGVTLVEGDGPARRGAPAA